MYNPSNKLTELHTDDQVYRYQYDAQGRLIEKSLPNQVTTRYEYTPASQLSALIHQKDQEILEKYQYQYDPAGNKQVIEKQRQGLTEDSGQYQYQYDALQRLTHVSKDQEVLRQYTYDAFGNRTSKQESTGSTTYQYNALNQLIKQDTPQETKQFNYDQRGNLVEELINNQVTKSFTFDETNMMTQVTTASGDKATYQYNGLRNRTGQTIEKANEPLKQIQYILDLTKPYNNLLERKVNEDKEQYLWDNDLLAKNEEEYFLLDDLGSPLRQLANTGQTIEEYSYDEFGQSLFNTPTNQPFGFTGYQQDEVSGMNYAQARYYDQKQGRFVSWDPVLGILTIPESINSYSYSMNTPTNKTDKSGLWFLLDDAIAAGVGAVVGVVSQGVSDVVAGVVTGNFELSSVESYVGAAVGGAAGGVSSLYLGPILGPAAGAAIGAGTSTLVGEGLEKLTGTNDRSVGKIAVDTLVSSGIGGVVGKYVPSWDKIDDWISGGSGGKSIIDKLLKKGAEFDNSLLENKLFQKFMDELFDEFGFGFFAGMTANEMADKIKEWFNVTPIISASGCLD